MKNWQEFLQAESTLKRIEDRFIQFKQFEQKFHAHAFVRQGFSEGDMSEARSAIFDSLRDEASTLPGKVYYWLYPFYRGNFLQLVAALGSCGAMEEQKDTPESRQAFFRFFRTIPMDERLQLGERLQHPELTLQAKRIQDKIAAKRNQIKEHFDQRHAN